jgi:hypothetical protein
MSIDVTPPCSSTPISTAITWSPSITSPIAFASSSPNRGYFFWVIECLSMMSRAPLTGSPTLTVENQFSTSCRFAVGRLKIATKIDATRIQNTIWSDLLYASNPPKRMRDHPSEDEKGTLWQRSQRPQRRRSILAVYFDPCKVFPESSSAFHIRRKISVRCHANPVCVRIVFTFIPRRARWVVRQE